METIFFWAAVTGFATWGFTLFFVGMIIVQSWREKRRLERANERLDDHKRQQYPEE